MISSDELSTYGLAIGGEHGPATGGATYEALNPFTGEPWALAPEAAQEDVDRAVAAARAALDGPWGAMTGAERAACMRRLAVVLRPGSSTSFTCRKPFFEAPKSTNAASMDGSTLSIFAL